MKFILNIEMHFVGYLYILHMSTFLYSKLFFVIPAVRYKLLVQKISIIQRSKAAIR